jgi:hypothetical protein
MKCRLNSSNLGHKSIQCLKLGMLLLSPQQGQYVGQFSVKSEIYFNILRIKYK